MIQRAKIKLVIPLFKGDRSDHLYIAKIFVNGKPRYIYNTPQVNRRKKKVQEEIVHTLEEIKKIYGRRPPGKGKHVEITSKKDLETILNNTHVAFISAGRNMSDPETREKPESYFTKNYVSLQNDLKKLGFVYTRTVGNYGLPERSMMVMCHDVKNRDEILKLCEKYRQESALFVDKGKSELIGATGEAKGQVMANGEGWKYIEAKSPKDDYYTEVDIAGKKVRFTMNLNFG